MYINVMRGSIAGKTRIGVNDMNDKLKKLGYKLQDHMLLEAIYDTLMKKTRFNPPVLSETYNIFVGQKHRMLFYKELKKRYFEACTKERPWECAPKVHHPEHLWFCWLQGLDDAPPIVKRCYESLKTHLPQKDIHVITNANLYEYIELPDYIMEKYAAGLIPPALFSDLIRLELLIRYGGYWIDATVFMTDDRLITRIDDLPLFMYSFFYFGFNPEIMRLNNWLILSTTNNNILSLTQSLLYAYWKEKTRVVNYFLFHIMNTMAVEYYEEEFKRIPIVSQVDSHILAAYIFDPFDPAKYELLKQSCGIHKLSIRFDPEQMKQKDTFYDYLIDGKLS